MCARMRHAASPAVLALACAAALVVLLAFRSSDSLLVDHRAAACDWAADANADADADTNTAVPRSPPPPTCTSNTLRPRSGQWGLNDTQAGQELLRVFGRMHRRHLHWLARGDRRFRAVVYRCTAEALCGGLGDRLKGIVSGFYLAALAHRAFFIDAPSPVPLSAFFDAAGHIDWSWPPAGWAANKHRYATAELVVDSQYEGMDLKLAAPRGTHAILSASRGPSVIVFRDNMAFWEELIASDEYAGGRSCLLPLARQVHAEGHLFNVALAGLLSPTCYLAEQTQAWETALFGAFNDAVPRIGVHLRTGLDVAFHDFRTSSMQDMLAWASNLPAAIAALQLHALQRGDANLTTPVILLIVDFEEAATAAKRALEAAASSDPIAWDAGSSPPPPPPRLQLAGVSHISSEALPLTHLELTDSAIIGTKEGNLRTFVEWSLLQRVDAHIYGRTGFALTASNMVCRPSLFFRSQIDAVSDYVYLPRGTCRQHTRLEVL